MIIPTHEEFKEAVDYCTEDPFGAAMEISQYRKAMRMADQTIASKASAIFWGSIIFTIVCIFGAAFVNASLWYLNPFAWEPVGRAVYLFAMVAGVWPLSFFLAKDFQEEQ